MDVNKWTSKRTKKKRIEKLQKFCKFPGCGLEYIGTGKSCYCKEHRKRKYRKIIDSEKVKRNKEQEEEKNPNQTIKHKFAEPQTIMSDCALEGCNNQFEIRIIYNTKVYPKYCEEHRNEFKRKRFLENN